MITHKEHELAVYRNARELVKCQAPEDKCLVFLADNIFVMRTREQALDIMQRQIQGLLKEKDKSETWQEKISRLMKIKVSKFAIWEFMFMLTSLSRY